MKNFLVLLLAVTTLGLAACDDAGNTAGDETVVEVTEPEAVDETAPDVVIEDDATMEDDGMMMNDEVETPTENVQ